MDSSLQNAQALALLIRDIEARRLPWVLELLDQVRSGKTCSVEEQVLLVDLLYAVELLSTLAPADDDRQECGNARRLCESIESLAEDIIAAALDNDAPTRAGSYVPDISATRQFPEAPTRQSRRNLPIAS
jgi:hypothetical protein